MISLGVVVKASVIAKELEARLFTAKDDNRQS